MSNEDDAPEAPVETVEAPKDEQSSPEAETAEEDTNAEAPQDAPEQKEETAEEKLARLESLEKKAQDAKKKINAQRKHIASLQKAADERARQLEEFKAQQQSAENLEPEKPQLDAFDSYEEYEQAQSKYIDELADFRAKEKYQQEQEQHLRKQAQEQSIKAQQERNTLYEAQKKSFMEIAPDYVDSEAEFNDYIQQAQAVTNPMVQDAIVTQAYREDGVSVPELIHYFGANGGENIGKLEEISKLSPNEAAVEVYKIQQQIKSNPTKREKGEPLPKPPQRAKGGGSSTKTLSTMSAKELLQWAKS